MSQLHFGRPIGPGTSYVRTQGLTPPARRRRHRRGVILLVALGVLMVFALAVVMFVISARQHKVTSRAYQRQERYDVHFEGHLDWAAMVVLRGSTNAACSLRDHGILENLYGNDSLPPPRDVMNMPNPDNPNEDPDPVLLASNPAPGPILGDFDGNGSPDGPSGLLLLSVQDVRLSALNGFYNGRVLTVLDGPARMQSTRIVGYNHDASTNPPTGRFQVLAFENGYVPVAGNRVFINGREFNGHGFGYNITTGQTDRLDPTYNQPLALLPNHAGLAITTLADDPTLGGADVSYNVPDHNNMHMAARVWIPDNDPSLNSVLHSSLRGGRWVVISPSFHRPDLVNWYAKNAAGSTDPTPGAAAAYFNHRYILRPLRNMHPPAANPSRPGFNYETDAETRAFIDPDSDNNGLLDMLQATINGQPNNRGLIWDVDNDGDGLVDSIWVDLGMPVQTAPDGRQYKPLFAILCLDMDSRFNLNTAGNVADRATPQGNTAMPLTSAHPVFGPRPYADYNNVVPAPDGTTYVGPGQGNITGAITSRPFFNDTEWGQVLDGVAGSATESPKPGKYGERDPNANNWRSPGRTDGARDVEDYIHNQQYPIGYGQKLVAWPTAGIAPPIDFMDSGFLVLDKHGNPLRLLTGQVLVGGVPMEVQHPGQFQPYHDRYMSAGGSSKTHIDSPITVGELEALQRRYDVDFQSLQRRLQRLVPGLWDESTPFARLRQGMMTALSHDLPVCSPMVTPEIRAEMLNQNPRIQPTGNHLIDLIAYKILSDTRQYPPTAPLAPPTQPTNMSRAIELLLSPDLARGERMNVNRQFGNDRDEDVNATDPGYGVIDEPRINYADPNGPTEVGRPQPEKVWWDNGQFQTSGVVYGPALPPQYQNFNNVPVDANNDGLLDYNDLQARQLMARNLYVLMMLLVDREYVVPTGEANIDKRRYTAQRIAQWAVNVVDYRDPDSISTPFEFDFDPFVDNDGDPNNGTWDVDGWIGLRPDGTVSPDDNKVPPNPRKDAFRGLVWGCERQQLVLKGSFGCHDIRTDDLDTEDPDPAGDTAATVGNAVTPDADFDQPRRPQGSLFLELFNPSLEPVPFEFRCKRNGPLLNVNAIDLSRLAPASNDPSLTDPKQRLPRPIWQLAIRLGDADVRNKPDTGHLDPTFPDTTKPNEVNRIVWFVADSQYGFDPSTNPLDTISKNIDSRIYHTRLETWNAGTADASREDYNGWENKVGFSSTPDNQAQMCLVGPGRYAVVGPRVRTRIGGSSPGGGNGQNITIRLLDDTATSPMAPRDIAANTNAAGRLVSDTPAVNYPNWGARAGVQSIQTPVGIVINYPRALSVSEPMDASYYKTPNGLTFYTDEPTVQYRDGYNKPLDIPLDPVNMRQIGWKERFATVYLQRLANPLEAWHPQRNPYLTVDYMPIDLNTFNGVYTGAAADPPVAVAAEPNLHFTTRERIGEGGDWNVWKQSFSTPEQRAVSVNKLAPLDFAHSFGFLSGFGNGGALANRYFAQDGVWTSTDFPAPSPYIGVPRRVPFPWFTWNDHPFVSQLELMNVPASSPSRLLLEHRLRRAGGKQFYNHYTDRDPAADELGPQSPGPPYGHLLNFCLSSDALTDANGGWAAQNTARSNLFRVFDFLRVPSRFNGSDQILNPQAFMAARLSFGGTPIPHGFHPPFNRISGYHDPGLVNINTLFDDGTMWRAIMNNDDPGRTVAHWRKVFYSRQGYGDPNAAGALLPMLDANSPTMFANPFRPFSDGYNVPVPALRNQPTAGFAANANAAGPARNLVDATLLRPDPLDPSRPLLAPQSNVDNVVAGAAGVGAGNGTAAYNDADRNNYFRYQGLTKLGNLVTTRSNVYSVWITVGYFEVAPDATLSRSQYPDGYTLGPELGSDTGEVTRHRMFFVVDRTIPVAFQRGEDFNVQKAILLKKVIE